MPDEFKMECFMYLFKVRKINNKILGLYMDKLDEILHTIIKYPVTITQNGIPNGTEWSVTLTGTTFNRQYINTTLSSTTHNNILRT